MLCSLIAVIVFQSTVTSANNEVRKILTVASLTNSSISSISIVPPTERPGNITKIKNVNVFHAYCQPWDSCRDRCGNNTIIPPYSCLCDSLCSKYGDCCIDYNAVCGARITQDVPYKEGKQMCLHENMFLPTYAIVSCPLAFTNPIIRAKCENLISPVTLTNSDGVVYANSYCADCHSDNGTFYSWIKIENVLHPPREFPEVRMCLPVIDNCTNDITPIPELSKLCQTFSGPVLGENTDRYYKNIYCALCNGEVLERLACPVWSFSGFDSLPSLRNSVKKLFTHPTKKISTFSKMDYDSLPASFSILLNFGLDGKERMMFSSEDEEEMKRNQKRCGKTKIWDPFSGICRTLYCSTEFILIDFRCIHKSEVSDDASSDDKPQSFDIEANCAHLILDIEISYFDMVDQNITDYSDFSDYLQESLASFFNITRNRIQGLNLTYVQDQVSKENSSSSASTEDDIWSDVVVKFVAAFDLCEEPNDTSKTEPTVDSIMAMIANYISLNIFILDIGNVSSKVSEIRQNMDPISNWCKTGIQKDYWNQEFTLILTDSSEKHGSWINSAYINKTGKNYKPGEFLASILFQGNRNDENLVNVSGVVRVCEKTKKLNLSCPLISLSSSEYNISNGTLTYAVNPEVVIQLNSSQYELAENNSVRICYDSDVYKKRYVKPSGEYSLNFDSIQAIVSLILSCISIFALGIVFITYLFFSSLRTLPGCNVMNLTGSTLAMQITFLVGQRNSVQGNYCKFAGILTHFEILATFFWMNIMAYDLYRTFGAKTMLKRTRDKSLLLRYALYAYGVPSLIIILASLLDTWYPDLGPHYGFENNCWITNKKAALLFFASPLAAILLINSILYTMTVCAISSLQKIIRTKSEHAQRKNDDVLYMRMATVMGFTWALAFFAAWYPQHKLLGQILTYLFIAFNTLQGLFIFFGFVCNKRVLKLYLDLLRKISVPKVKPCYRCRKHFCNCQPNISRTTSSESTFSVISDSVPTLISYNAICEK